MNKKDIIIRVSEISELDPSDCEKMMDALEKALSDELESSKRASDALDKIYKIIGFLKNK